MPDVTETLTALKSGRKEAAADLLPLVYDELRWLAAWRLANEPDIASHRAGVPPRGHTTGRDAL